MQRESAGHQIERFRRGIEALFLVEREFAPVREAPHDGAEPLGNALIRLARQKRVAACPRRPRPMRRKCFAVENPRRAVSHCGKVEAWAGDWKPD